MRFLILQLTLLLAWQTAGAQDTIVFTGYPTTTVQSGTAYSTDTCHSFHVKPATQTAAKLPPDPRDDCHPAERSDALFTL